MVLICGIPVAACASCFTCRLPCSSSLLFLPPRNCATCSRERPQRCLCLALRWTWRFWVAGNLNSRLLCAVHFHVLAERRRTRLPFSARTALAAAAAAPRPEGRLAFAGWILGTLAIAASVLGFNAMLGARADYRQATLLGKPAPRPTTAAPPAAIPPHQFSPARPRPKPRRPRSLPLPRQLLLLELRPAQNSPQDAKYWQNQAKKLEETLDDPNKVEAYYSEKALHAYDNAKPVAIDLTNVPSKGFEHAPVTVVEYSDFLCVYCRQLAGALSQFVPAVGGRVNIFFKTTPGQELQRSPDTLHAPRACNLALGSICANNQGKFGAYHDRAFSSDLNDPQIADVVRIGGEAD